MDCRWVRLVVLLQLSLFLRGTSGAWESLPLPLSSLIYNGGGGGSGSGNIPRMATTPRGALLCVGAASIGIDGSGSVLPPQPQPSSSSVSSSKPQTAAAYQKAAPQKNKNNPKNVYPVAEIQAMAAAVQRVKNNKDSMTRIVDQAKKVFDRAMMATTPESDSNYNNKSRKASLILAMLNLYANVPDSAWEAQDLLEFYYKDYIMIPVATPATSTTTTRNFVDGQKDQSGTAMNDEVATTVAAAPPAPLTPSASTPTVAYNTLLKAWKNSRDMRQAIDESGKLLQWMKEQGLANTLSYTTYLNTLAAVLSTTKNANQKKSLALKAQRLLQQSSVQANARTYNAILQCWCMAGDLARAEQLLQEMEDQSISTGRSSTDGRKVTPTISSYTTLMSGWAKSDDPIHLSKMQSLFDRAVVQWSEHGNVECKPNQFAYATLIHAHAKTRTVSSAMAAERLLRLMYQEYCEQQEKKSNQQKTLASSWESEDIDHENNGTDDGFLVIPNTQLVTAVMDCWRQSGSPDAGEKTEALLQWMMQLSQTHAHDAALLRPNVYSFSSAIASWARTRVVGKAVRARRLLQQMKQWHEAGHVDAAPNAFCYTNVLNAAAYCIQEEAEQQQALRIAIQTYKELLHNAKPRDNDDNSTGRIQPTHVTFSTFLTALRNLLPSGDERTKAVMQVFETAKMLGQVDPLVIKKVQAALSSSPPQELQQLGIPKEGPMKNIPSEWARNVAA